MAERTEVVVIGSGFAGIGMGIKLKAAGRHNFVILEKAAELGGTWRDNTYPGCTCDVPSYLYPFSYEQNPEWSRLFSPREEIWDYLRRCVDKYDLGPHLRFNTEVTGAVFDEATSRWDVEVNGSEIIDTRVVVSGVGALHMPKLPDLPGIELFEGTSFHSSQWQHDHDLTGRNVAVVGTGASAIQFVPKIAEQVARLDLYQRSAAWITPKGNPPITPKQQDFYRRHPASQRAVRDAIYWALELRGIGFALTPKAMRFLEKSARQHLERQVSDPELRARLTPDYQIGCKRILLSSNFYPALTRDNVELVTEPIAEITPAGIVDAHGIQRDVDTIIYGTGFDVSGNLTHMKVVGRDGAVLNDVWDRNGIGAHLGITVSGFPNFFLLLGPNTGLAHSSVVFMIESQVRYIISALDLLDSYGAAAIEVRVDAQRSWLDRVQHRLHGTVWDSGCSSWYLDATGRNISIWPHFTWKYWMETRTLKPADFQLVRPRPQR
jgi:cation diffusion facilitator CzcD-associated flavoprotein CzcO